MLKKYPAEDLKADYDILRNVLEKFHPSLYWYTPKDSMDMFFDLYRSVIKDSMTQQQFGFGILAPLTAKIHCGHTSFNFSKSWSSFFRGLPAPSFPLHLKIWGDTMIVLSNLNRKDSLIRRGMQVKSVNGLQARQLTDIMFEYMAADGYAQNVNYIRLSNSFPYYHRNIFGLSRNYLVTYLDSLQQERTLLLPVFNPRGDTSKRSEQPKPVKKEKEKRPPRKERLKFYRSLEIDTANQMAIVSISSFDDGYGLKKFLRRSFKEIRSNQYPNLAIDLRNNGGGRVNNFIRLAKYIKDEPFKVADTVICAERGFGKYGKYIQRNLIYSTTIKAFTRKREDGKLHYRYWEKHTFKPYTRKHYNGNVYVIISGPTFSASTLFCHTVQHQKNVTLVGEETGGGDYGNNGMMIPYVTLPNTRMRVSLPLFRIVQHNPGEKDGRGVKPDVLVEPSASAIRSGIDRKMEMVKSLIHEKSK